MSRPRTGTVWYVPPKGDEPGHYVARVSHKGKRPLYHLEPSPKSPQAEKRARETAGWICEELAAGRDPFARGIVAPTDEATEGEGTGTVSDWFDRWLKHREASGLSSVDTDRGRFKKHVEPALGHLQMATVSRAEIEGLVERLDEGVQAGAMSWKTAINAWGLVSKAFGDASAGKVRALRVRDDNPAAGVRGPDRGDRRAKAYLYPSEFSAVMACADVPTKWRRMIALATCLYVRAGELRALTWDDVDVERGIVHVHRATDRQGRTKATKTGITRRFAIEPVLLPLLRAMHSEAGGKGNVVALPKDTHIASVLRDALQRAEVKRADLFACDATRKPMTWHDLRATGLTWLAVRGDDPLKIMQRAGHTDFKTTQIYVREAEAIRDGFGDVFPRLPKAILSLIRHGDSSRSRQVSRIVATPPGLEPGLPA